MEKMISMHPDYCIVIVGDFYMLEIEWPDLRVKQHSSNRRLHQYFVDLVNDFNLDQHVREPTRVKGNILDLVFTTHTESVSSAKVIEPGMSDHFLIELDK